MAKLLRVLEREHCIGCYSCMQACSRTWFSALTCEKAALRVRNYTGVEGAFSIRVCYGCPNPDCAAACQTGALTARPGGGITFDPKKCAKCGDCARACVPKALQWDYEHNQPIPCRQCGVCVQFCPNGVLGMIDPDAPVTEATAKPAAVPAPTAAPAPAPAATPTKEAR